MNDLNAALKLNDKLSKAYQALRFVKHGLGDLQGAVADFDDAEFWTTDREVSNLTYFRRGTVLDALGGYVAALPQTTTNSCS